MPVRILSALALVPLLASAPAPAQAGRLDGLWQKLQNSFSVVKSIAGLVREYPAKLRELRVRRAMPPPFDLGFDPAKYKSAAGQLELLKKAELLLQSTRRHLHDKILITGTDLHPDTHEILRFHDGIGDAGCHQAWFVAALAYRYGVTGDAAHLAELKEGLVGLYNQMTITSAPGGYIFDVRTGQRLAPRVGLPVRGYANIASPLVKDMKDISKENASVFGYQGPLEGLPSATYHFNSDISRDELDGLFYGLGVAWEILTKKNVEPVWRQRIGQVMAQTMRYLVANGYKFIDFTGKVAVYGDQSSFAKDPTMPLNVLSWFSSAVRMSGDAALRAEMNRFADKYFGKQRLLKSSLFAGALSLAGAVARPFPELIGYTVNSYNYILLIMWGYNLVRDTADPRIRALGVDFLENFVWPLAGQARVPFFDYVYMTATRKRDPALVDRAIGVLGQVRAAPIPFGNPASKSEYVTDFRGRAELRDPLHAFLTTEWERIRKLIPGNPASPFLYGGSIWPLGPGLVPKSNHLERASAYDLKGVDPYAWSWTGDRKNLRGYPAHDYLLSYWFGRYSGLLGGGAAVSLEPLKKRALASSSNFVNQLVGEVRAGLERAWRWARGLVHRLEGQTACVSRHVRPLATELARSVQTPATAKVQLFFAELGPSLATLSTADKRLVVDDAFAQLTGAIRGRLEQVRAAGEQTIAPWFGKSRNRDAAKRELGAILSALGAELLAQAQAAYDRTMK